MFLKHSGKTQTQNIQKLVFLLKHYGKPVCFISQNKNKPFFQVEPLWVSGAGHNDVEMHAAYLERLRAFIEGEVFSLKKFF